MSAKTILKSGRARPSAGMRPYCIVLRDLGEGVHMRYVTHRRGLDELGGYTTGHYFKTEDEGRGDFAQRCQEDRCRLPEGFQL